MKVYEKRKSVQDLVKTFESNNNQNKEIRKTNTVLNKIKPPAFPTLKKLPSNINNKYTEEKNQINEEPEELPQNSKETKNEKENENNPFASFWKNAKNKRKINDDSNVILKKKK